MATALIPLASERPVEVSDNPATERKVALWVGAAFFVGFLGWAAATPLDAGAFAQGVVAVSGSRQAVQHREGGVVSALLVKEGDTVMQGQPLLRILSGDAEAEERGLTSEYLLLLAQRARLTAERDGRSMMEMPAEFASLPRKDRVIADEALRGQKRLLQARRGAVAAQKSVLGQRSRQADAQIDGYGAAIESTREQRRLIQQELEGMRLLEKKGFASINRVRALERAAAELDGNLGQNAAMIARTRETVGENRMQALSIDRSVTEDVDTQLRDATLRINDIQPKLGALRAQIARAVVRAPASGRVVGLSIFTVGGVVSPGQTLMEIVPHNRELVIKARISPDDADDVYPGMTTRIRFPSFHERDIPYLEGRLTTISADSLTDEKTGIHYFGAEVRVPESELRNIEMVRPDRPAIQAGLPAELLIPLEKRTVFGYLLEPLLQSSWRAGREH